MKNMHPETTEFYAKMVEKIKVMSKDFTKRRSFAKAEGNVEDSYKVEEKDAFTHSEVTNMNNGEMLVFANGKVYKAVAQAESSLLKLGKKTTYEGASDKKIPLTQYVNKKFFFQEASKVLRKI